MNSNTTSKKTRPYRSTLRDGQAQETRALILKAVGETLSQAGPEGLSALEVARRAGVTARTLYRHFGSKEGLLTALRAYATRSALPSLPETLDDLLAFPHALFATFDAHAPWVEALLHVGPGTDARAAGKSQRLHHFHTLIERLAPELPSDTRLRLTAIVKLLLSVEAWKTLRDDFGLQGESAAKGVTWALERLLNATTFPAATPVSPAPATPSPPASAEPAPTQCSPLDLIGLSFAVTAALESGLLKATLEGPPRTAQALAAGLELDPIATERVLDPLVAAGLLRKQGAEYGPGTPSGGKESLVWTGFEFNRRLWAHTSSYLRSGKPMLEMDGSTQTRAALYGGAVTGLGMLLGPVATRFAATLTRAPKTLLDVGCGSGVWSLAVAQRFPETHVTGLDLGGVLPAFQQRADHLGLASRISCLQGDMFEVPLPDAHFELILLANVLRLEPPARAKALITRLVQALKPGGALVILDALAGGSPEQDVARTVYALHLSLRTRHGTVHGIEEVQGWLAAAGLVQAERVELGLTVGAMGGILAYKTP